MAAAAAAALSIGHVGVGDFEQSHAEELGSLRELDLFDIGFGLFGKLARTLAANDVGCELKLDSGLARWQFW
jgi:hypothetical protein